MLEVNLRFIKPKPMVLDKLSTIIYPFICHFNEANIFPQSISVLFNMLIYFMPQVASKLALIYRYRKDNTKILTMFINISKSLKKFIKASQQLADIRALAD